MTGNAAHAIATWEEGRRRRAAHAMADRMADGLVASGGIVLADAMFSLGIGLPAGRTGASLGGALLVAGISWIARARRGSRPEPQPVVTAAARQPAYRIVRAERAA